MSVTSISCVLTAGNAEFQIANSTNFNILNAGSVNSFSVENFSEAQFVAVDYFIHGNQGLLVVPPKGLVNANFGRRIPSDKLTARIRSIGVAADVFSQASGARHIIRSDAVVLPLTPVFVLIVAIDAGGS